ncbi:hypothetical protein QAD02_005609 [Eretmocerus hayati]|uniref:Uncharacterized protein n=1 Tax=Eretmocerus hayati TaxID=131215 RepID=A0ACC2NT93_9HYME|nr:hypothetical protein QAD02_005609 [Eretmocerus hayati]
MENLLQTAINAHSHARRMTLKNITHDSLGHTQQLLEEDAINAHSHARRTTLKDVTHDSLGPTQQLLEGVRKISPGHSSRLPPQRLPAAAPTVPAIRCGRFIDLMRESAGRPMQMVYLLQVLLSGGTRVVNGQGPGSLPNIYTEMELEREPKEVRITKKYKDGFYLVGPHLQESTALRVMFTKYEREPNASEVIKEKNASEVAPL